MATTNTISAQATYVTDATATSDALVLDTSSDAGFDFFSLEDPNLAVTDHIRAEYADKGRAKEEPVEEEEVEYADEDGDEVSEDDDDLDFDSLDDLEDEAEDEEDTEESEESDDAEPAEEEVDYEGYEVTLPSGETIKLNEAVRGYKATQELEAERASFEEAKSQFEETSKEMTKYLELAKLEAQKVIEDYDDFNWQELARTDPAAYVDNKEFLEKYQERYEEIVNSMKALEAKRAGEEKAAIEVQARQCASELQRDIVGWGPELYQQLMEYGVENGATQEQMLQCVDPAIFKMMHKAMQFDKGRAVVKAKVKTVVKQPSKVAKVAQKELNMPDAKKTAVLKKVQSGNATTRDMDAMFSMLED